MNGQAEHPLTSLLGLVIRSRKEFIDRCLVGCWFGFLPHFSSLLPSKTNENQSRFSSTS